MSYKYKGFIDVEKDKFISIAINEELTIDYWFFDGQLKFDNSKFDYMEIFCLFKIQNNEIVKNDKWEGEYNVMP